MEITFTKLQDAGITAAREAFNATLPEDSPDRLPDNAAYIQQAASGWADSYVKQFNLDLSHIDEKIAAWQARRIEAEAKVAAAQGIEAENKITPIAPK